MAIQTFVSGQVLTAAQVTAVQSNQYNQTVSTKTASYVLVAADVGTRVVMNAAGATTITVNTSLFSAGDTLRIHNIGAGACTITAGTATVNSSTGSLVVRQYDSGELYFTSAAVAIFFPSTMFAMPRGIVDTTAGGTSGRGFIAIVAAQSNTAAAGEVDITNATMTFTGVASRYYQASLKGVAASTSSAGLATFAVYTGGVKQMLSRVEYSSNGYGDVDIQYVFSVTGSTTVKFTIDSDVATTTIFGTGTSQGQMTIQDIGPA